MNQTLLELLERAIDESTRSRDQPVDKSDFPALRLYGTGRARSSTRCSWSTFWC
jgi:hypothetical protein